LFPNLRVIQDTIEPNSLLLNYIVARAQPEGAKGAEAHPLARLKLRKKISPFRAVASQGGEAP